MCKNVTNKGDDKDASTKAASIENKQASPTCSRRSTRTCKPTCRVGTALSTEEFVATKPVSRKRKSKPRSMPRGSRLKRLKAGAFTFSQLLDAAKHNREAEVQLLLKNGVDVNKGSRRIGMTALMAAAEAGHANMVKVLLRNGAKANLGSRGYVCISIVCVDSSIVVLQLAVRCLPLLHSSGMGFQPSCSPLKRDTMQLHVRCLNTVHHPYRAGASTLTSIRPLRATTTIRLSGWPRLRDT